MSEEPATADLVEVVTGTEGRATGVKSVATERASFTYEWVDGTIAHPVVRLDIDEARIAPERLAEERG